MSKDKKASPGQIASNKKAFHDYHIEERFEAGLVLEGWEVKSIRDARVQLKESYVMIRGSDAYIIGMHISPLSTASTHVNPDPVRTRKLLLHRKEIDKLIVGSQRKGQTIVPLSLYWKKNRVKMEIALAKGKKLYDKRESLKEKAVARDIDRAVKQR